MRVAPRVLSIDLGTKNFCYCVYDGATSRIEAWERLTLPPKGKQLLIPRLAHFLHQFGREHAMLVDSATHVIVEQQMTSSMRIMEAILYAQYLGRSQSVNARTVKRYWREQHPDAWRAHPTHAAPTRDMTYRLGKQMAMRITRDHLLPLQDERWRALYESNKKKDDLADSLLQAVYYCRTWKQ